MRTSVRVLGVAALSAVAVPMLASAALAASYSEPVAAASYFFAEAVAKPDAAPADPAPYTNQVPYDQVGAGNLAVAVVQPNASDKESFLRFDLVGVPLGATITKAVVSVPLQPDDNNNHSLQADPAKVKACAADSTGFADGVDAGAYDEKPGAKCDVMESLAKASADGKAYEFDVTKAATTWLTQINNGIALIPAVASSPFQVVFQRTATIAVEYSAATVPTTAPSPTVGPVDVPVDTGGFVPAPVDTGGAVGGVIAPQPVPTAPAASASKPVVAAPQLNAPVTKATLRDSMAPTSSFWLAVIAIVLMLGFVSVVMGDRRVAPVQPTRRGVGRALDQRRRGAHLGSGPSLAHLVPARPRRSF